MFSRKRSSGSVITGVLCMSGTVVALPQTLVLPLVSDLPTILNVNADNASWVITITLLTSAVAIPIVTRLADMYGKRLMMIVSIALMLVGAVLAAIGNFSVVLVGRGLQGFAFALIPIGMSILRDELPREKVALATAIMSATFGVGAALGLPLAGIIYGYLGWSALFWISAAAALVLVISIVLVVPESEVRTKGHFDFLGSILLSITLAGLLLAISKGSHWGWTSSETILVTGGSVIALAVWLPYQLCLTQPLVDLRTSTLRTVLFTNIATILIGFSMYANVLVVMQELQMPKISGYGFGLSIIMAGVCVIPAGMAMVVLAPVSATITNRYGAQVTLVIGAFILAVSYVGRVYLDGSISALVISMSIVSIGPALTFAAIPTLIMQSVPNTQTASANGLNTLLRAFGTALSSATVAAILTSVTFEVGSVSIPTGRAFDIVFWCAAGAALAAAVLGMCISSRGVALGTESRTAGTGSTPATLAGGR